MKKLSEEMWDWSIMDGHIRPDEWKVQEWSRRTKELEDAAPGWIRVEDRLPEVGKFVLTFGGSGYYEVDEVDYDWPGRFRQDALSPGNPDEVTHWMPLPDPPEE